jgi:hypothetical protein
VVPLRSKVASHALLMAIVDDWYWYAAYARDFSMFVWIIRIIWIIWIWDSWDDSNDTPLFDVCVWCFVCLSLSIQIGPNSTKFTNCVKLVFFESITRYGGEFSINNDHKTRKMPICSTLRDLEGPKPYWNITFSSLSCDEMYNNSQALKETRKQTTTCTKPA